MIFGKNYLIWWNITVESFLVKASDPNKPGGIVEYIGCLEKNSLSISKAYLTLYLLLISLKISAEILSNEL